MAIGDKGIMHLADVGVAATQEVPGLAAVGLNFKGLEEVLDGQGFPGGLVTKLVRAMVQPTCKGTTNQVISYQSYQWFSDRPIYSFTI